MAYSVFNHESSLFFPVLLLLAGEAIGSLESG